MTWPAIYRYILTGNSRGLHTSPFFHPAAAHLNGLTVCMAYLSFDYISFNTCTEDEMFQPLLEGKYQLLSYCQKYWIYHLDEWLRREIEQQPEAIENIASSLSRFVGLRARPIGMLLHQNLELSIELRNNNNILATKSPSQRGQTVYRKYACLKTAGGLTEEEFSVLLAVKNHDNLLRKKYASDLSLNGAHLLVYYISNSIAYPKQSYTTGISTIIH